MSGMAAAAANAASCEPAKASAPSVPEVPSDVDEETQLLEDFTRVPILTKATLRPAAGGKGVQATVQVAQHNLAANSKRQLQYTVHVPDAGAPEQHWVSGLPTELQPMVMQSVSPSGKRMLVAKAGSDGAVLEFWSSRRLVWELQVPKSLHGGVINDNWFSKGAAWSPDESRIVYVAEAPTPEKTPQWSGLDAKDQAAPKGWRGVAQAQEDWGELNTNKKAPTLYVLDAQAGTVTKVAGQPEDHSCGQPCWTPDGTGIVFQAWSHRAQNFNTARRLGVVFCYNRTCHLYYVQQPAAAAGTDGGSGDSTTQAVNLTRSLLSASAPLFTPDGTRLLFLSHQAAAESGVHSATVALMGLAWPQAATGSREAEPIVPVVQRPDSPGSFPGLYAYSFVEPSPFIDDTTLLLTSAWYSQTVILAVNVVTGAVRAVTSTDATAGSWTLQGVCGGLAAAVLSRPSVPPALMLVTVPSSQEGPWDWRPVAGPLAADQSEELPARVAAALSQLDTHVLHVKPTVGDTSFVFEAIVQVPRNRSGPCPAIVVPHGGPHTSYAAAYYMPFSFLTALGYCIVAVNYRGSTGFGEAALQSLPGHAGAHDTQDCVDALDAAIKAGYADGSRSCVVGGSHGGFLAGHLMGQHPDRFKAAVLRNPVMDIALMTGVTDIPDWCYVETFGTTEGRARFKDVPSPEELAAMYAASPVAHLDKVAGPMLFLLGSKDRRVPEDVGRRYVDALRSKGVPVRLLVFPEDTHALDKPQTEFEQWLNCAWWLKQHVPGKDE